MINVKVEADIFGNGVYVEERESSCGADHDAVTDAIVEILADIGNHWEFGDGLVVHVEVGEGE